MKDLLTVVKEATNQIRVICAEDEAVSLTTEQLQRMEKIVKSTYLNQSFWWKIKNTFDNYKQIVAIDLQFNFIGGVTV